MSNSGYESDDAMQSELARAILVDSGLMTLAEANYEITLSDDSMAIFKTFSKDTHNGLYVKFDPAVPEISF
jgi:hypothetical protein